jgi:SAM-dependent methyltransferase
MATSESQDGRQFQAEEPLLDQEKAITLGHPSYVWGYGQKRRLDLVRRYVGLEDRVILDVGCGLGMYVRAFRNYSQNVYGVDIDEERVAEASQTLPNIRVAPAEHLPYPDGMFDVVLSHEVIEHVEDDRRAIAEAARVLRCPDAEQGRPGGRLVVFAPNRLHPFETHGAYWGGTYHFGNIPLINYLPNRWRARLCPHVRAYTKRDLRSLLEGLPLEIVAHRQIYPAYDKIVARRPRLGNTLRRLTHSLEDTPLQAFGLSHLLIAEKIT